jgi:hypothetical protein
LITHDRVELVERTGDSVTGEENGGLKSTVVGGGHNDGVLDKVGRVALLDGTGVVGGDVDGLEGRSLASLARHNGGEASRLPSSRWRE